MYLQPIYLLLQSIVLVFGAPNGADERRPKVLVERQGDVNQLLSLASLAGITALPTDPAVLLQLGPVAQQLASALPTSPVLSVLQTAAPPSFISNIVNNPGYASSFEADFSAGKSPDWFTALPSSVKSYLHTYQGFGQLASEAQAVKSASAGVTSGSGSMSSGVTTGESGSGTTTSGMASETSGGTSVSGSSSGMMSTTSATSALSSPSGSAGAESGSPASRSSSAGAAQQTAIVSLGAAGILGVLGLAIAL